MIFLSVTGSFTAAVMYDRREKKRLQKKWCTLVSHMADETLPTNRMRRNITVYLSPPPGDSLSVSRGYFREYVKPILVAAALDYNVVEGRREGDLRAKLAEKIRKFRRRRGEPSTVQDEVDKDEAIILSQERQGLLDEDAVKGDLIIGRSAWKEYIRGLHEGWLGPLDPLTPPEPESSSELLSDAPQPSSSSDQAPTLLDESTSSKPTSASSEASPDTDTPSPPETKEEPDTPKAPEKPKRTPPPPAYIPVSAYSTSNLSPNTPPSFDPSLPLPFPHILGFLNTPIRIYRFLTQRRLADSIGRDVAALVLATQSRPYAASESFTSVVDPDDIEPIGVPTPVQQSGDIVGNSDIMVSTGQIYEQSSLLSHEETEWPKRVRQPKPPRPEGEESVWLDAVVLDPRIAERMNRFELDAEDEARARRIGEGKEGKGGGKPEVRGFWEKVLGKLGWGEKEERNKVVIGNLEGEDGE
jgi:import inner membrane translocase subunit TIM54